MLVKYMFILRRS